jgi:hypothetical protein
LLVGARNALHPFYPISPSRIGFGPLVPGLRHADLVEEDPSLSLGRLSSWRGWNSSFHSSLLRKGADNRSPANRRSSPSFRCPAPRSAPPDRACAGLEMNRLGERFRRPKHRPSKSFVRLCVGCKNWWRNGNYILPIGRFHVQIVLLISPGVTVVRFLCRGDSIESNVLVRSADVEFGDGG